MAEKPWGRQMNLDPHTFSAMVSAPDAASEAEEAWGFPHVLSAWKSASSLESYCRRHVRAMQQVEFGLLKQDHLNGMRSIRNAQPGMDTLPKNLVSADQTAGPEGPRPKARDAYDLIPPHLL